MLANLWRWSKADSGERKEPPPSGVYFAQERTPVADELQCYHLQQPKAANLKAQRSNLQKGKKISACVIVLINITVTMTFPIYEYFTALLFFLFL